MGRDVLVLVAVFACAILLAGCSAPQYYSCCLYGPASGHGECILANGTAYDTQYCDMDLLTCNATVGDEKVTLPICAQMEEIKCNSSCMGMFCGRFEYDPRPPPDPTSILTTVSTSEDLGGLADVKKFALYGAECRFLNMSAAVIRASANTRGGFALNSFRFGIGNSFEDFEQASLYYPITDLGCQLNPMGDVDRYTNYAIPNTRMDGGRLCEGVTPDDARGSYFRCTYDTSITSPSYYDCAVRCMMAGAEYPESADPFNPYLTYKDGMLVGNPFSYGLAGLYSTRDSPSIVPDVRYRDRAMAPVSSGSAFNDNYYSGFTYYGADFSTSVIENSGLNGWFMDYGVPEGEVNRRHDYYYGEERRVPMLKWNGHEVELITMARDPHPTYATLLSYHSVYGNEIAAGHTTKDGTWKPGAEFECLGGQDCISSMCSKDLYARGVCTNRNGPGLDALCDCMEAGNEIICEGRQSYYTTPWDNPEAIVRGTYTLSAVVAEKKLFGTGGVVTQTDVPSKGKMVTWDYESDGIDEKYIVIYLGGPDPYPDYKSASYTAGIRDTYRNETLTLDMVLSREKWRFCDPERGCGRFFTTFVDECFGDVTGDGRPDIALNYVGVCYSSYANGILGSWGDGDIRRDPSSLCNKIMGRDEFFCYEEDEYGRCKLLASAALVIQAGEVDYTTTSSEGRETTVKRLAFGNCIMDEDGEELEVRTYGVCEPCSYLTVAKESVVRLPENQDDPGYEGETGGTYPNNYCPVLSITTPYYYNPGHFSGAMGLIASSAGRGFSTWESGGGKSLFDSFCTMPDGSGAGKYEAWPDYLPNAYYLKEKIGDYQKRNILPVIFADDGVLYKRTGGSGEWDKDIHVDVRTSDESIYYSSHPLLTELADKRLPLLERFAMESAYVSSATDGYMVEGSKYLANSLYNQGAAIVVVETDDEGAVLGPYISNMTGSRSNFVKALCPNCMIAIGSGYYRYGDPKSNEQKMAELMFTFWVQNATTRSLISGTGEYLYGLNFSCEDEGIVCENLDGVDVIAEKWVINGQTGRCDIEDREERFEALLAEKTEFGSKMMERFGKPIMVADFIIERGGPGNCWTDADAAAFMTFLGQHTEELVRGGHIGLIYSDWTTGKGDDVKTGLRYDSSQVKGERGDAYAGSLHASRYFSGFNQKSMITEVDVSASCQCMPCLPTDPDSICNGRFMGVGQECEGYSGGREKWQDYCVSSDVCIMGSSLGAYNIHCNIYYANGIQEAKVYDGMDVAENPLIYKDVISAIKESGTVPCFTSTTRNISYTRLEAHGFSSYPLVFRKDGNLSYSCSPSLETEICGYKPPFTDTQMDCMISMKGIEPGLPPLGERIVAGVGGWPLGGEATGVELPRVVEPPVGTTPFGGMLPD